MVRRFFIDSFSNPKLIGQQHNHLKTLRLKVGSNIEIFDSNGIAGNATIIDIGKTETKLKFEYYKENDENVDSNSSDSGNNKETEFNIDLATSLPKLARAEWMIEKLSEIGIRNLFLLETEYSKSSPSSGSLTVNKLDRFQRIVIEASKQSRNNTLMNIIPIQPIKQFLNDKLSTSTTTTTPTTNKINYSNVFLCDPTGKPLPQIFDEIKQDYEKYYQLQQQQTKQQQQSKDSLILIGAEGGFSKKELALIQSTIDKRNDQNCKLNISKLGDNILRMETAAIVISGFVNINIPYIYKNKK